MSENFAVSGLGTITIMPKEMINVTIQRKQSEPWGMVVVGGKDQALTVKVLFNYLSLYL